MREYMMLGHRSAGTIGPDPAIFIKAQYQYARLNDADFIYCIPEQFVPPYTPYCQPGTVGPAFLQVDSRWLIPGTERHNAGSIQLRPAHLKAGTGLSTVHLKAGKVLSIDMPKDD